MTQSKRFGSGIRFGLRIFGRLPQPVRRMFIRAGTPTYTAGTLAIIERDDGRWLFVQPVYRPGWALPGGLLNRGELAIDAIHRELLEELGLLVNINPEPWAIVDSKLRRIDVVWRATVADDVDIDAIEVRTVELVDVGWFDPDNPPPLETESDDAILLRKRVREGGPSVLLT